MRKSKTLNVLLLLSIIFMSSSVFAESKRDQSPTIESYPENKRIYKQVITTKDDQRVDLYSNGMVEGLQRKYDKNFEDGKGIQVDAPIKDLDLEEVFDEQAKGFIRFVDQHGYPIRMNKFLKMSLTPVEDSKTQDDPRHQDDPKSLESQIHKEEYKWKKTR